MSISGALSNAVSGLTANARQLSATSDNLANALTKGYAARSVDLGARAGASGGVRVISVDPASDPMLSALRREADGDAANAQVRAESLAALASAFGELGDPESLFERQVAFEGALRTLADAPESTSAQNSVATKAADLANAFNRTFAAADAMRTDADREIARLIGEVNSATSAIAELNDDIRTLQASGRDTAPLVDERNNLINDVAVALPVRADFKDDGTVTLRTDTGLTLVDRTAQVIAFTPTPIVTSSMSYSGGAGALSGLTLSNVDITPGGNGVQRIDGGALNGLFMRRDVDAPAFQTSLDALAEELVARLDAPGIDPTRVPGVPGIFTDAGLAIGSPATPGLAGRLTLNPLLDPVTGEPALFRDGLGATSPGPQGADAIPRAFLAALSETSSFPSLGASTSLGYRERIAASGEDVSTLRLEAEGERAREAAARDLLAGEEARILGVDPDAELQALIRIEQAYAANAQVVETAARMLDELRGALR